MTAYSYATLEQIRDELKQTDSAITTHDPAVNEYRREITRRIERKTGYKFVPEVDTKHFLTTQPGRFDHYTGKLLLPEPLLAITSVVDADRTALTVWDGDPDTFDAADVMAEPINHTPYHILRRLSGGNFSHWSSSGKLVSVAGVWGYHSNYAGAWVSSGAVLAAQMSAGAASFTVTDALAADSEGYTPRFSPGQVIRIGSEALIVTTITDGTPDTVGVAPGALGTTAALHLINAPIDVWKVDDMIVRACRRWAAYAHTRRGVFNDSSVDAIYGAQIRFPADIPEEVENILNDLPRYDRSRVRAI